MSQLDNRAHQGFEQEASVRSDASGRVDFVAADAHDHILDRRHQPLIGTPYLFAHHPPNESLVRCELAMEANELA